MGRETAKCGNYAELRVIADAIRRGYSVSIPYGHETRYDLIIDTGKRLLRVQVKNARLICGAVMVKTCSSGVSVHTVYNDIEIDYIAAFEPKAETIYYVPITEVGARRWALSLRIDKARNNQESGVRYAEDFKDL
jgi:hypothetical protein